MPKGALSIALLLQIMTQIIVIAAGIVIIYQNLITVSHSIQ